MSPNEHDALSAALDVASGRRPADPSVSEAWLGYAEALRDARRAVRAEPGCPTAFLRRAQGLFEAGRRVPLLRLVFDSWSEAAPALRGSGPARSLRYEGGEQALDVRVRRAADGALEMQLAVEPPREGLAASFAVPGAKRARRLPLDAAGCGETRLPAHARSVTVEVRAGRQSVLRVDDVPLD